MSARIISFVDAKNDRRTSAIETDFLKSASNSLPLIICHSTINETRILSITYNDFIKSMHTRKSIFMFPTMLSGYRHHINPVDTIYNTLQKTLFNYDNKDLTSKWIIELFSDSLWTDKLCDALENDCKNISIYQIKYNTHTNEVKELERIRLKFLHYIEVFKLMKSWEEH